MAMQKCSAKLRRVGFNLPEHIDDWVREYAKELGINTTNAYIMLLNEIIEQKETIKQLPESLAALSKLKFIDFNNAEQLKQISKILTERR